MRAVMVSRHGGPEVLELADLETPSPGPRQLLVDVAVAGVNFRDVYEREGIAYGGTPPFVAGAEGSGTVAAIGEGVTGFRVGDRVAWSSAQGSYAEHVLVDTAKAVHVPDGVSDEIAAAVLLQGMTAHYLCNDVYPVQDGDTVLVHAGAGGVGLLLTQLVRARGGRVIATVSTDEKAALSRAAGASRRFPTRVSPSAPETSPTARASPRSTTGWERPHSTTASRASACAGPSRCTATRADRSTRSTSGV